MKIAALFAWSVAVLLSLVVVPSRALAAPADCAAAYEKAQEERAAGRLISALDQLERCVVPACPGFVRDDCRRWKEEVEGTLPSLVFVARRGKREVVQVRVSCDGKPFADALDGTGVPVDPGQHAFTFESADGVSSATVHVLVREDDRRRLIEVSLPDPNDVPAAAYRLKPPRPIDRPQQRLARPAPASALPYVTGSVALAGLAGFTVLAVLGKTEESDLAARCAPSCEDSDLSSVRLKYLLADVSLGVALVAAGVTAFVLLSRANDRRAETATAASPRRRSAAGGRTIGVSVRPEVSRGGGQIGVEVVF